jgi:hypothetical protein
VALLSFTVWRSEKTSVGISKRLRYAGKKGDLIMIVLDATVAACCPRVGLKRIVRILGRNKRSRDITWSTVYLQLLYIVKN